MVNTFSSAATQSLSQLLMLPFEHRSSQRQQVNKWVWLCTNTILFIQTGGRPDLTQGPQFANLCSKREVLLSAFNTYNLVTGASQGWAQLETSGQRRTSPSVIRIAIPLSHENNKRCNIAICNNMDGSSEYYAK